MKQTKKALSLLLALAMILALTVAAFGATGSNSITITTPLKNGDTFKAYQIFAGTYANMTEGETLSDITWGDGVSSTGLMTALGEAYASADTAAKVAEILANNQNDSEAAQAFAAAAANNVTTTTSGTYANGTISGLADGYYLVMSDTVTSESAATRFIMAVAGGENKQAAIKADTPSMEKKVMEKNDTTGATSDWQYASDYDIGDAVPYRIETTIVSNYADYAHYYLEFQDKMEAGLTFNEGSVVVKNGTSVIPAEHYVVTPNADGLSFKIVFNDLKKVTGVGAGSTIYVEYSARLNESAVLGSAGNKNEARMIFANNPNATQEGKNETGETPWKTVITFTYKTTVNKVHKVESKMEPLAGAGFTLYKKVSGYTANADELKNAGADYKQVGSYAGGEATTFTFTGLDAGTYKLVETTTPSGYNTIDPIEFMIASTFGTQAANAADKTTLTSLSVTPADKFTVQMTEGDATYTGNLETSVENTSGSVLPSTGGMGTTIFYVVGCLLVAGAGVLLIAKRRAGNSKEIL